MKKSGIEKKIGIGFTVFLVAVAILGAFIPNDKFTTHHIASTISGKLSKTPWSDLKMKKATGTDSYTTEWSDLNPKRSMSVLQFDTNLIQVSTRVSGDLFNPQETYNQINTSFEVFATLFPVDQESLNILRKNLPDYINTMFKSAKQEVTFTDFDSVEEKIGNITLTAGAMSDIQGILTNGNFYVNLSKNLRYEDLQNRRIYRLQYRNRGDGFWCS